MQTAIKVEQLSKAYENLLAVDKINLSVKCGTVYGLLGANGAGKGTTIECILGTKNADSGTVSVLNCNPQKIDAACSKKLVSNFKREIISRKLKYQSYAGKPPACMKPSRIGKAFANNLA